MTPEQIEQIAKRMTWAQCAALKYLANGEHKPGWGTFNIILKGLADYRRRWWLFGPKIVVLTPFGLAVRRYLMEQDND